MNSSTNPEPNPTTAPAVGAEDCQRRLLEMLEAAARSLLADHIKQREAQVRAEVQREFDIASIPERLERLNRLERRARRRIKAADEVALRYRAVLDEVYEQLSVIIESIRENDALQSDLQSIMGQIEEALAAEPDEV